MRTKNLVSGDETIGSAVLFDSFYMLFVCLVNNVGYFQGHPGYFGEFSEEVSCDVVK